MVATGMRLVTASVVAENLGLSTDTVTRWAGAGKIPCHRLSSKCIRFDMNAVMKSLGIGQGAGDVVLATAGQNA